MFVVRPSRDETVDVHGFLDATNWRLIYGLNFGCGSIERAADEASFVAKAMGDRLIAFQLGNEDDQFGGMPFFEKRASTLKSISRTTRPLCQRFGKQYRMLVSEDPMWQQTWVGYNHSPNIRTTPPSFSAATFTRWVPQRNPGMDASFLLSPNARLAKQSLRFIRRYPSRKDFLTE